MKDCGFTAEADLYGPVKSMLEAQGFEVKGEVGAADVVGVRADEPPVIVELKLRFSLGLYHQAIARFAITDAVYIAAPRPTGKTARRMIRDNRALCRRLGLGLVLVRGDGRIDVLCDPGPYAPRKSKIRQKRLLSEFNRRRGDPNAGGSKPGNIVTTYRQDAIACAEHLAANGASQGAVVARETGVPAATRIMRDNHYGWFSRAERGVYELSEQGREALAQWCKARNI